MIEDKKRRKITPYSDTNALRYKNSCSVVVGIETTEVGDGERRKGKIVTINREFSDICAFEWFFLQERNHKQQLKTSHACCFPRWMPM